MPEETKETKQPMSSFGFIQWCGKKIDRLFNPPSVVVVLGLSGVIMSGGRSGGAISIKTMGENIQKAFTHKNVKAVALSINSPGGSPVQSALVAKRIRDFAEEKDIPVFAFVEDVAASGGYWLSCAADEIYANESSIVGSIGVISAGFGFSSAIDKLGIERRVHTSGDKKAILDPFEPEKKEDIKILKDLQKELHENFISYVQQRRGDKLKGADKKLFSGEFWTGTKAVDLGLVDEIGELREVMKEKFGEDVEFKHIQKPRGWLERRLGLKSGIGSQNLAKEFAEVIEEQSLWQRFGL